jgi:hypothetical protein
MLGLVLLDFGNYIAICIIEYKWSSIVSVLLKIGYKSIGYQAKPHTMSQERMRSKLSDKQLCCLQAAQSHWLRVVLAAPQQPSWASSWWRWAWPGKAVVTRPALHHHKNIIVLSHSTTTLEHHPTKPWINTWSSRTIPGGEGQATSSNPRRWRASSHSGGEGQATRSWTRRRRPSQEQATTHQQEVADQHQDLNTNYSTTGWYSALNTSSCLINKSTICMVGSW